MINGAKGLAGNLPGQIHYGIQGPPGPQGNTGNPGGYYTPSVTQLSEETLQFEFTPSKSDMPTVKPITVELPTPDSGGNVELDPTMTKEGKAADAKAVGDILATLTLGQHTDGLIYIFIGGKPVGNGLSINSGEVVEPVYGQPVTDNAILSIAKGQTVQLGIMLSEEPTQEQTITILTECEALSFDKTVLTFTPDNWNVFQFVSVTAGDVDEDTSATITLRNSDELLTDTAITVYLTADAYSVDMTIPEGAYTATPADFDSVTVRSTGLVVDVYTGAASNGATNVYIPPTMEYEGTTYTTIIKNSSFTALPDTVEYLHIDQNCVYTPYGTYAATTTNLTEFGVNGAGLIGLKYAAPTATQGQIVAASCPALKWVDGLSETKGIGRLQFENCTSLEYVPDLSGHTNITEMNSTFRECTSLKKVYGMPPNLTKMVSTFYHCSALEAAEVPSGVTYAFYAFNGCTVLKTAKIYAEGISTATSIFDGCEGTKVYVPEGSTTYTTLNDMYGSSASVEILFLSGESLPVVSCWGDSTTSAGTDGEAWPTRLQTTLGESMQVKNMAISGEFSTSTSCRQGGNEASIVSDVTIPAAVEAVAVTLQSKDGQTFGTSPVLSTGANYNPVTIAGVEGTISTSGSQAYFTRKNAGDAVAVSAGTAVVSKNAVARKEDAVQVIYLGTNAGWNLDPNTLLNQVQSMVEYYGGTNYIIMGPAGGQFVRTEEARAATLAYEELAAEAFGEHWLNLREYLIANSLTENGLTATEKDNERMAVGLIPWSILLGSNTESGTDDVHYNTHGLQSVCNAVYAKGQALGYWE